MAAFVKYTPAVEALMEGVNCHTDTWKVALSNTINASDSAFVAGTTDLATGGGYTAGGNTATVASSAQSGGTYKLVLNSPTAWTATGPGFTFRYVILYVTDSLSNKIPVGYWDYTSSIVMNGTNGDTFTVTLDPTNGVFSIAP